MRPSPAPSVLRRHGPLFLGDGRTRFSVWAPRAEVVELLVEGGEAVRLDKQADGYHVGVALAAPGTRYRFVLDGAGPFADPASRLQPEGVDGPSEVTDEPPAMAVGVTGAPWRGVPLSAQVICEVHVGTFSSTGSFDGVAARLPELADAGYTMVELMPVGAFSGARNWGYDGVFPFAVQASYGGPDGLRRLCEQAHRAGLGIILDVVYNHLGPEGAVHEAFGPYLTDRYATPWGKAVNLDGPGSDEVRRYFIEHALYVIDSLGIDGLRLDAVHELYDQSASSFLSELVAAVHAKARQLQRYVSVVAESPANDWRLLEDKDLGGSGCDGLWNDDFHHALRVALTGQADRCFADYRGLPDLAKALVSGFCLTGQKAPSRGRHHGASPARPLKGDQLVVFAQNHDQIGNGGLGRRLSEELGLEAQFPICALVLLSGWVPLRFMGEEYGETAPFYFFVDHGNQALLDAVRAGRRAELAGLGEENVPDPGDRATFEACKLRPEMASGGLHAELLSWQRALLALRKAEPALGSLEPERSQCFYDEAQRTLALVRRCDDYLSGRDIVVLACLSNEQGEITCPLPEGAVLSVLASRNLLGATRGQLLFPGPNGQLRLRSQGYGVLIAACCDSGLGGLENSTKTRSATERARPAS